MTHDSQVGEAKREVRSRVLTVLPPEPGRPISAAQAGVQPGWDLQVHLGTCYHGASREPCSHYVHCSLYAMQLAEDQKISSSKASRAPLRAVTQPYCPTSRGLGNTTQQHAHSPTLEGLPRERRASSSTALQRTGQIRHIAPASPETLIFSLSAPCCAGISPMEALVFLPLCSRHTDPVQHMLCPDRGSLRPGAEQGSRCPGQATPTRLIFLIFQDI